MFSLLIALLVHPVHETFAELDWNDESKRTEVALRLDILDEQSLTKQFGQGRDRKVWAPIYLARHFRVGSKAEIEGDAKKAAARYHWVGREQEGAHVWWFFEIETRDGRQPTWVEQRMMLDRQENYVNRVLVLDQTPKRTVSLHRRRPRGSLSASKDERPESKSDSGGRLDRG